MYRVIRVRAPARSEVRKASNAVFSSDRFEFIFSPCLLLDRPPHPWYRTAPSGLKGSWPCWFGKPCRWDVAKRPGSLRQHKGHVGTRRRADSCAGAVPQSVCVSLPSLSLSLWYFPCITAWLLGLKGGFHRSLCVWQMSWWLWITQSPLNCKNPFETVLSNLPFFD